MQGANLSRWVGQLFWRAVHVLLVVGCVACGGRVVDHEGGEAVGSGEVGETRTSGEESGSEMTGVESTEETETGAPPIDCAEAEHDACVEAEHCRPVSGADIDLEDCYFGDLIHPFACVEVGCEPMTTAFCHPDNTRVGKWTYEPECMPQGWTDCEC